MTIKKGDSPRKTKNQTKNKKSLPNEGDVEIDEEDDDIEEESCDEELEEEEVSGEEDEELEEEVSDEEDEVDEEEYGEEEEEIEGEESGEEEEVEGEEESGEKEETENKELEQTASKQDDTDEAVPSNTSETNTEKTPLSSAEIAKQISKIITDAQEKQDETADDLIVRKDIDLDVDVGHLLVTDSTLLDENMVKDEKQKDLYFGTIARDGAQALINKVWNLPHERITNLVYVQLPKPKFRLPREKPLPVQKPMTKWQRFAEARGIKKKKKPKKQWDELLKKWVPTYGFQHAIAERERVQLQASELAQGSSKRINHLKRLNKEKKEKMAKNEFQRLRNVARAHKIKVPKSGIVKTDFASTSAINQALDVAHKATASVGKFQCLEKDEKHAKLPRGKRPAEELIRQENVVKEVDHARQLAKKIKLPTLNLESSVSKHIKEDNVKMSHVKRKELNKRRSKMGGSHTTQAHQREAMRAKQKNLIKPIHKKAKWLTKSGSSKPGGGPKKGRASGKGGKGGKISKGNKKRGKRH